MAENNSIVSFGDLGPPAKALIEAIERGVGELFLPWQMRRVAKAAMDVRKVEVLSDIDVRNIESRALQRSLHEETEHQRNMEAIMSLAVEKIQGDPSKIDLKERWVRKFFEQARKISDAELQALWAEILAMEAKGSDEFSLKTLSLLSDLEQSDALLFTKLCSFWVSGTYTGPLVIDIKDSIYTDNDLEYSALMHLEYLGLIHFAPDGLRVFFKEKELEEVVNQEGVLTLDYFDTKVSISENVIQPKASFGIGIAVPTEAGRQLQKVCSAKPVKDFPEYIKKKEQF